MITFQTGQTIDRSADDVWAYAADISRHPDWMTVTDARVLNGPGTRAVPTISRASRARGTSLPFDAEDLEAAAP